MVQSTVGERDQPAGPGDRMADRVKQALRIAEASLDGGGECRELQGCGQIHA
jgi:hypothetical protein